MSNIAYQRLDELLEKRPLPKTFDEVKVELMKPRVENPVDEEGVPTEENKPTEEIDEIADEDDKPQELKPELNDRQFKVVDKRRSSMLDRLAIIKRIQNKADAIVIDEMEKRKDEVIIPVLTTKKLRIVEPSVNTDLTPVINTDESNLLIEEEDGEPIQLEEPNLVTKAVKKPRKLRIKGKVASPEEINNVDLKQQ